MLLTVQAQAEANLEDLFLEFCDSLSPANASAIDHAFGGDRQQQSILAELAGLSDEPPSDRAVESAARAVHAEFCGIFTRHFRHAAAARRKLEAARREMMKSGADCQQADEAAALHAWSAALARGLQDARLVARAVADVRRERRAIETMRG